MSCNLLRNPLRSAPGLCAFALCAFALQSMDSASAATRTVGNCNDHGPGSLRAAVAAAASGDTIDLASLGCNRIVLTSRGIQVTQDDLELVGRNRHALTIDGNRTGRVFRHTGTGTLRLRRVSIANGYIVGPEAVGGCIRSEGSVELIGSRMHHCQVRGRMALEPTAMGGGIHAGNRVLLSWSSAFANIAAGTSDGRGGAVAALGEVVLYRSQVYGNRAAFDGGGIWARRVAATYSTIHGNRAGAGGGIYLGCGGASQCTLWLNRSTVSANAGTSNGGFAAGGADALVIIESTVSGNIASSHGAGSLPNDARIFNSTIVFNEDRPASQCSGALSAVGLHLVSSIVSGNTCTLGDDLDIDGLDVVTGSNNIIGRSQVPVPPDTIDARPRLAPLADNGGPTRTHRPLAGSPALAQGINPLNCRYDQRGPGFPRVKGGFPDIGAVER